MSTSILLLDKNFFADDFDVMVIELCFLVDAFINKRARLLQSLIIFLF